MTKAEKIKLQGIWIGLQIARTQCNHLTFRGHVDSPIYGVSTIELDKEIEKVNAKLNNVEMS